MAAKSEREWFLGPYTVQCSTLGNNSSHNPRMILAFQMAGFNAIENQRDQVAGVNEMGFVISFLR